MIQRYHKAMGNTTVVVFIKHICIYSFLSYDEKLFEFKKILGGQR